MLNGPNWATPNTSPKSIRCVTIKEDCYGKSFDRFTTRFFFLLLQLTEILLSKNYAAETYGKINDSFTSNDPAFYGAVIHNPDSKGTSHISGLDRDGLAVSVTTTVNT